MWPIVSPKTSAAHYQLTQRNVRQELRSPMFSGEKAWSLSFLSGSKPRRMEFLRGLLKYVHHFVGGPRLRSFCTWQRVLWQRCTKYMVSRHRYENLEYQHVRSGVRKFPAWHTKVAPNWKCFEGYIVPPMVRLMYQLKSVLKYRETVLKNSKNCFISVTLKSWSGRKLLDPTAYIHNSTSFQTQTIYAINVYNTQNIKGIWSFMLNLTHANIPALYVRKCGS